MRISDRDKMIGMGEMIRLTGLPRSSPYILLKEIPHYRWGHRILLREADLLSYMDAHRVPAAATTGPIDSESVGEAGAEIEHGAVEGAPTEVQR
jgi:hypothetical protein